MIRICLALSAVHIESCLFVCSGCLMIPCCMLSECAFSRVSEWRGSAFIHHSYSALRIACALRMRCISRSSVSPSFGTNSSGGGANTFVRGSGSDGTPVSIFPSFSEELKVGVYRNGRAAGENADALCGSNGASAAVCVSSGVCSA